MRLRVQCLKCERRDQVWRTGGADHYRGEEVARWHPTPGGSWLCEPCLEEILQPLVTSALDRTIGAGAC